jgi:hypoxanthine-DNA glycosylase
MPEYTHIIHPFDPLYDEHSKILILGSLPSVKSREQGFFYGHPQNRYWRLIAAIFDEPVPQNIEEKKALVLNHHIAMWDAIYSCDIIGSGDSSIKNVVPTDLSKIIRNSDIKRVFCNGKTSGAVYHKYQEPLLGIEATVLPSTSPANAAWSFERLVEVWREELERGLME